MRQRIIIQNIDEPKSNKIKDEVKWICDSLGLIRGRDIDCTSFKIMYKLLSLFSKDDLVSTEKLANSLKISPSIVNHHVRSLMESRIIFREKKKIALRGGSLSAAINEMRRDTDAMFLRLLNISEKIDKIFKL